MNDQLLKGKFALDVLLTYLFILSVQLMIVLLFSHSFIHNAKQLA